MPQPNTFPPHDFSFGGKEHRNKQLSDSRRFTDNLTASIPTVICAVCAEIHGELASEPKIFQMEEELFNPLYDIHGIERNQVEYYDEVHASRIFVHSRRSDLRVCKRCFSSLSRREVPSVALVNQLDWGDVPVELQGLNIIEQRMIAIYNSITSFVRMSGGRSGVLGGISHLINDIASWAKVLPRDPSTCGILNIMIQRPNVEGESQRHYYKEVYSIRVERVKSALFWLKANNAHYTDVVLDFGKLDFWSRQPKRLISLTTTMQRFQPLWETLSSIRVKTQSIVLKRH